MTIDYILSLVCGDAGAIVVLMIFFLLFIAGKVFPRVTVDDLKEINRDLREALSAQDERLESIEVNTKDILDHLTDEER